MKFINPKVHGVLDYLAVVFLFAAPSLFGYSGQAATLAYAAAILQLSLSLMTAYPLGVFKAIPFPIHGMIELSLGLFLAISPWVFGFDEFAAPRNLYLLTGLGLFGIWTTTNYEAAAPVRHRRYTVRERDIEEFKKRAA